MPWNHTGMSRRLIENLIMPEAELLQPQRLCTRHRGSGVEDQIMEDGIDKPRAQKMKDDLIGTLRPFSLNFIQAALKIRPLSDGLKAVSKGLNLSRIQHVDAGQESIAVELLQLIDIEAEALKIVRRFGG